MPAFKGLNYSQPEGSAAVTSHRDHQTTEVPNKEPHARNGEQWRPVHNRNHNHNDDYQPEHQGSPVPCIHPQLLEVTVWSRRSVIREQPELPWVFDNPPIVGDRCPVHSYHTRAFVAGPMVQLDGRGRQENPGSPIEFHAPRFDFIPRKKGKAALFQANPSGGVQ
jgi:hypothetical protein